MKAITLRNVPSEVARRLEKLSEHWGLDLERTVLRVLEEKLVPEAPKALEVRRHDDLHELAGAWSKKEAEEFDRALAEQRQIDLELWD